jgi:hypothetical protein
MMMKIVKEDTHFIRLEDTNAIVSTNVDAYKQYKKQKREASRINKLEQQLTKLLQLNTSFSKNEV